MPARHQRQRDALTRFRRSVMNRPVERGLIIQRTVNQFTPLRRATTERLATVLSAVDRILGHALEGVELVTKQDAPAGAPAWTDGVHVYLNVDGLPDLTEATTTSLITWLGANAHEVGHSLFSPRFGSPLYTAINARIEAGLNKNLLSTFNLIEDQRQERLLIAKFPPWRTYLTQGLIRLLTDHEIGADRLWPILVGRTWLPAELRVQAKADWSGHDPENELAKLVGQYQRLGDPGEDDADEAFRVLVDIDILLSTGQPSPSGCKPGYDVIGSLDADDDPDPMVLTADDDVVPSAGSAQDTQQLDDAAAAQQEGEGDQSGSTPAGDSDTDDVSDPSPDGNGETEGPTGDRTPPAADEATDLPTGGQVDPGTGPSGTPQQDAVDTLREQVIDQISTDKQVQADLANMEAALDNTGPRQSTLKSARDDGYNEVTPETRRLARDVAEHLRRLTHASLPQWLRRTDHGRLNVRRYLTRDVGDSFDTMFDKFEQGLQDEVSLDVTVLVDVSGSMSARVTYLVPADDVENVTTEEGPKPWERASEAVWAIQQAVEAAEGDCTVIGFDDTSTLISQTGRRAPSQVRRLVGRGNTDPVEGLRDTWRRLRTVEAANKVVVIITDGYWTRESGGDRLVEDLNQRGVVTVGVQIDPYLNRVEYRGSGMTPEKATEPARVQAWLEERRTYAQELSEQMGTMYTEIMDDTTKLVPLFERVVAEELIKKMSARDMATTVGL